MKNKLKYLSVLILIACLFSLSVIHSSAVEESQMISEYQDASVDENLFSELYENITSYAGEILCALTFIGSLLLAFAYKKGLLPLIQTSLVSIGSAITKIKDHTRESTELSSKIGEDIEAKLSNTSNLVLNLAEKISLLESSLNERLKNESTVNEQNRQLKLIINTQIDMLYDVFMSSALPQYQKDAVGQRVAKMKEAIATNETEK